MCWAFGVHSPSLSVARRIPPSMRAVAPYPVFRLPPSRSALFPLRPRAVFCFPALDSSSESLWPVPTCLIRIVRAWGGCCLLMFSAGFAAVGACFPARGVVSPVPWSSGKRLRFHRRLRARPPPAGPWLRPGARYPGRAYQPPLQLSPVQTASWPPLTCRLPPLAAVFCAHFLAHPGFCAALARPRRRSIYGIDRTAFGPNTVLFVGLCLSLFSSLAALILTNRPINPSSRFLLLCLRCALRVGVFLFLGSASVPGVDTPPSRRSVFRLAGSLGLVVRCVRVFTSALKLARRFPETPLLRSLGCDCLRPCSGHGTRCSVCVPRLSSYDLHYWFTLRTFRFGMSGFRPSAPTSPREHPWPSLPLSVLHVRSRWSVIARRMTNHVLGQGGRGFVSSVYQL